MIYTSVQYISYPDAHTQQAHDSPLRFTADRSTSITRPSPDIIQDASKCHQVPAYCVPPSPTPMPDISDALTTLNRTRHLSALPAAAWRGVLHTVYLLYCASEPFGGFTLL
jgi:hypothetical protein